MEHTNNASDSSADLPQQQQESSIQEYLTILMRGKWVVLAVLGVVTAATAVFTFRARPVYESTAMVLVDVKSSNGQVPMLDIMGMAAANKITNELETLKSRSMAEAAVRLLLKKQTVDSEGKEPIAIIHVQKYGDLLPELADEPEILKRLGLNVEFTPIRDSDIIKIMARSQSPAEAALLANTYTEAYTDRNLNTSRLRSRAVREFLQSQLEAKHLALDTTEAALQSYMRTSGMVDMDTDTKKVVDQLSQLEATRDGVEVDIKTRTNTLNSYKQELERLEPNVARAIGESNDAYIVLLQEQLAKLEVQRDVTIAQNPALVGKEMYSNKLKEIDEQITALRKNLKVRTDAYLSQLTPGTVGNAAGEPGTAAFLAGLKQKVIEAKIELDGLSARKGALNAVLAEYERQFNQIPEKVIELAKRQRARLSTEKLYLLVEEKFNEAAITETSEIGYVNVIDPAAIPLEPVSPKVLLNIVLGIVVGLFLGVAVVMVRAYMDDTIQTPEDLKKAGYSVLSAINRMRWDRAGKNGKGLGTGDQGSGNVNEKMGNGENGNGHNGNGHNGHDGFDARLIAHLNPFSPVAEAYRHLRTNLMYADADRPLKRILVTSAGPGEGKSTTASNLAIAFAQTEKRVLLVDADMRRASIHTKFNLRKEPGLTDLLFGRSTFAEAVQLQITDNLDILTCGTTPPNPAETLGSRKMREFIDFASSNYDIILFDSPPLLAVTDASVLARAVDGAVLVCSAGSTRIGALERASEFLATVGRTSLGVVLNNFDVQKAYGGYYGYQRYGHYGYGYGYYASKSEDAVVNEK